MTDEQNKSNGKRLHTIRTGEEQMLALGALEGEILRRLWDSGEPMSSVQLYEVFFFARREEHKEMESPATLAVALSRLVQKGFLTVERRPLGGKGYYTPVYTRAEVLSAVLNDVSHRLAGQPLGYLLKRLHDARESSGGQDSPIEDDLSPLIAEWRQRE